MTTSEQGGLAVAVTGPTGDIGMAFLRALEEAPEVGRVVGMARSPFDPGGLTKVEYRRGDILDAGSLARLVEGADVVVHLAFMIMGSPAETREINLQGSRNVFEAAFRAGIGRLVYTSSVAAYGFHEENPDVMSEDVAPRGSDDHYYSAQKAEVEKLLANLAAAKPATEVYVFRPCIVAGPTALSLIQEIPYVKLGEKIPSSLRRVARALPVLRPVVPDPGVPLQLVHEDDVAQALVAGTLGKGEPGAYNLAGEGELTITDIAHALGYYAVPLPDIVLDATIKVVSKFPYLPPSTAWLNAVRTPVLMDCTKAREKLGWQPRYDALDTLNATVHAAIDKGLIHRPT
ncbi:MAG: NAD-dependent epimerase/dehydratase family protein [Actinobacteria bacterium]|nr:NAD-dependent epimerase/dehydratase family protein [Actinomycetota bacterium]